MPTLHIQPNYKTENTAMKSRRGTKLLIEPPASATGDIAFNLIVFFLVCASSQPGKGIHQTIPRADKQKQQQQTKNIVVNLQRRTAAINGDILSQEDFQPRLEKLLAGKTRQKDRIVIVKSEDDVPYRHWIAVTETIDLAGGIVTIEFEE